MMFDSSIVDTAVKLLRECEKTKHLGKPARLLTCETEFTRGVGVEWPGEIRNAVAFKGPQASENYVEAKRRIEEWVAA